MIPPVRAHLMGANRRSTPWFPAARTTLFRLSGGCGLALVAFESAHAQGLMERLSLTPIGSDPQGYSYAAAMSAAGRFVAFLSEAPDLIANDANGVDDVFVLDRASGTLERADVSSTGAEANDETFYAPGMSADGRFVVFVSRASNLVPGDTNDDPTLTWDGSDVFVRDRMSGTTERVSLTASGAEVHALNAWPTISADGRFVAFGCDADLSTGAPGSGSGYLDTWVKDRQTGAVSQVNLDSAGVELVLARYPRLSADGRFVTFRALFIAPPNVYTRQIFVRDLFSGTTEMASVSSMGAPGNYDSDGPSSISSDGRFVAFQSLASNLVPGDTPARDVFVRDRTAGTTEKISVSTPGVDVTGGTSPFMSSDGRYVAFSATQTGSPPGGAGSIYQVLLRDRLTGATTIVSASPEGTLGDGTSFLSDISSDGLQVLFTSLATNLVPGAVDTNALYDVYVHQRATASPLAFCASKLDAVGCQPQIAASGVPSITSTLPFVVTANALRNNHRGRLHYSLTPSALSFEGGVACIGGLVRPTRVQFSGGSAMGDDCSGVFASDFNALIRSGLDPSLVPGTVVYCQYRYADPGNPSGFTAGLSNALVFAVGP